LSATATSLQLILVVLQRATTCNAATVNMSHMSHYITFPIFTAKTVNETMQCELSRFLMAHQHTPG